MLVYFFNQYKFLIVVYVFYCIQYTHIITMLFGRIDLATLTGAIIVSLGQEYAGLFCNDDKLAERLTKWRRAYGRKGMAHAARARIRQDDRFQVC